MASDTGGLKQNPEHDLDSELEPEVVRWLRAYCLAPDANHDVTLARILEDANQLLCHYRTHPDGDRRAVCETHLRVLTEQMPAVLWTTDANLRFTSFMGGGLSMVGLQPAASVSLPLTDVVDPDSPALAAHARALQGESAVYECEWRNRCYLGHVEALRGPDGAIVGTVGAAMDLTERKRAEESLARREEQLAEAQRLAQIGSWEWKDGDEIATWSDELYRIWGLDPPTFSPRLQDIRAHVYPADRDAFDAAVESAIPEGRSSEFEHRIIRPDGEVRHLHVLLAAVLDNAGQLVRLYGTCQDVTERRLAEAERVRHLERQARLDGMLFAARQLAARATTNLASSSGAMERLQPDGGIPPNLRDLIDTVTTGLSEAARAIAELERVIQPGSTEQSASPSPDAWQASARPSG